MSNDGLVRQKRLAILIDNLEYSFYNVIMVDLLVALQQLSAQMHLEPDGEQSSAACPSAAAATDASMAGYRQAACGRSSQQPDLNISQAQLPDGRRIALLKTLLTSACERNCHYCPFRQGRDFRRQTLKPDEMARALIGLQQAGLIQGAFLSSGVAGGGVRTQDQLLATAEILRRKYGYRGYLHLKLMPGAQKAQVEQALRLADRVSINLEAPNAERLKRLAPGKEFFEELFQPLRWAEEIRRSGLPPGGPGARWPSLTTQFVVGAAGESDLELLQTSAALFSQLRLSRVYYSAFRPQPDTPLEDAPPTPLLRQHRLYQASFLLRDYGFDLEDLPFWPDGSLPLAVDPKTAWAQAHLTAQPLEINRAERRELLRIPGIGPRGAEAILQARRQARLRSLEDLQHLGVRVQQAAAYILLDGRRPAQQLSLF